MSGLQHRVFSLEYTPREIKATEDILEKIYEGAKYGLTNASLAYHAGLTYDEYKVLVEFDPRIEAAKTGGKADSEKELAVVMRDAALNGDAKAALEILKHKHGWAATQTIKQEISGADGGPITLAAVDFRGLSNEELQTMKEMLKKSIGSTDG